MEDVADAHADEARRFDRLATMGTAFVVAASVGAACTAGLLTRPERALDWVPPLLSSMCSVVAALLHFGRCGARAGAHGLMVEITMPTRDAADAAARVRRVSARMLEDARKPLLRRGGA